MHIVHICLTGTYTDGLGYQENYLAKFHRKSGNEVTLIANEWAFDSEGKRIYSSETDYVNRDDVHVYRLRCAAGKIAGVLRIYHGIRNLIEKLEPDILFIHGCAFWSIYEIIPYLKKHKGVRVYVDNHADYSNSATNWLSKNILHKIIWRSCACAIEPYTRKFYGVLPARVDFLTELYHLPSEKCELLVMGADDDAVEAASKPEVRTFIREKYGIETDDFLVMTGGKIDLYKTQTLLLMEAVHKIKDQKARLIVFGSVVSELKERVLALADGRKVQYIGWVKSEDSYPLFAAADLVVFPGRHSVFWEQVVGQGKPMLVKDWPGTHHIDLGGNVRFLEKDSVEEIQKEIENLIVNPEVYEEIKNVAEINGKKIFSYRQISRRAIEE